jgi:NAD(P)-dependent dehydrogenase (short-subunit alcohol dehydrogenase family)
LRANVVSTGWTYRQASDSGSTQPSPDLLGALARRLPVGRIGAAADVADAIRFLMRNDFVSGTMLEVDGVQRLVCRP